MSMNSPGVVYTLRTPRKQKRTEIYYEQSITKSDNIVPNLRYLLKLALILDLCLPHYLGELF